LIAVTKISEVGGDGMSAGTLNAGSFDGSGRPHTAWRHRRNREASVRVYDQPSVFDVQEIAWDSGNSVCPGPRCFVGLNRVHGAALHGAVRGKGKRFRVSCPIHHHAAAAAPGEVEGAIAPQHHHRV
jgi:hypothetical protein